jgi:hypothetical protein
VELTEARALVQDKTHKEITVRRLISVVCSPTARPTGDRDG